MVCKQRKYALKQASLVLDRFIEQLVVDVDLTGVPLDIGIKGDILDQFKAHLTGISANEGLAVEALKKCYSSYPVIAMIELLSELWYNTFV